MPREMSKKKKDELELQVMAHRYLYYVLANNVLADHEYDVIENKARANLPEDSPVHDIGSDLSSSYSAEHIAYAQKLLANAGR